MIWNTPIHTFDLSQRALVMGVLNVTDNSFSDGGAYLDPEAAVTHGLEMAAAGADIIDVGGESTRPGAEPVSEQEELARVLPVITALARQPGVVISIDTMKPAVAHAALAAGAQILNDVGGLRDPQIREVLRATGAAAIAMHMQGTPRDMQIAPFYTDVIGEIREFFRQTLEACLACGIDSMRLAFDPGIGFGKRLGDNLALVRDLEELRVADRPLVLGVSRKSFIGKVLGSADIAKREWPTVALSAYGRAHGANVLRVHDVRNNLEALRMTEAILG